MTNLSLREKIIEFLSNYKYVTKKGAALGAAAIMTLTPVMSTVVNAESNANGANTNLTENGEAPSQAGDFLSGLLAAQPQRQHYEMTLEEFENGAKEAYQYLSKYINYEHMIEDVLASYYITNYDYISDELAEQLIAKGYIADTDMFSPDGVPTMDSSGWKNINYYNRLVNNINDFNEDKIEREYKDARNGEGAKSAPEAYIDASILCAEQYDREDMHELFQLWYDEYNLEKDTIRSNDAFMQAHKHLTQLNSGEGASQLYEAGMGARYSELKIYGNEVMDFQTDYLDDNYDYQALDEYFIPEELRQNQWFLRDDFNKQQECPDELYFCARMYGEHYHFVRDEVNKELFSTMRTKELARDASQSEEKTK